jgi:hypothetical protein
LLRGGLIWRGRSWPGRSWPGHSWRGLSWPGHSWRGLYPQSAVAVHLVLQLADDLSDRLRCRRFVEHRHRGACRTQCRQFGIPRQAWMQVQPGAAGDATGQQIVQARAREDQTGPGARAVQAGQGADKRGGVIGRMGARRKKRQPSTAAGPLVCAGVCMRCTCAAAIGDNRLCPRRRLP